MKQHSRSWLRGARVPTKGQGELLGGGHQRRLPMGQAAELSVGHPKGRVGEGVPGGENVRRHGAVRQLGHPEIQAEPSFSGVKTGTQRSEDRQVDKGQG